MAVQLENPTVNSVRIQRAYRVNQVEKGRLFNRLTFLEQEKIRRLRLVNQDIRMINLTMEFIQSCSGHSEEGMSPEEIAEEEETEDLLPCFQYGERTNSRRFGKNSRRVHSAITLRRGSSDSGSTSSGSSGRRMRPQSGPANMRTGLFMTTGSSDSESMFSDSDQEDQQRPNSRSHSIWKISDAGFSNPMKSPERKPPSRQGNRSNSRPSISMSRSLLESHRLDGVQGFARTDHVRGRLSRMPAQVNPRHVVKSADKIRSSGQKWISPVAIVRGSQHQKKVMECKKSMNMETASVVNDKLKAFFSKTPVRKY